MSDILEHIMARRSIRKYTDEAVTEEEITRLLKAAMAAPSASNRKPWEFVVITEPDMMRRVRSAMIFGRYNAPMAIVVCGNMRRTYPPPGTGYWVQDCSAATQNILLAAAGMGLGSVWLGVYPISVFVARVRRVLNLPSHIVPLNVIYVGHPAQNKTPRTQYDPRRVRWQQYAPTPPREPWWRRVFSRRAEPSAEGQDLDTAPPDEGQSDS